MACEDQEEVGVTALQDQSQHFDLDIVMLQTNNGSGAGDIVSPTLSLQGHHDEDISSVREDEAGRLAVPPARGVVRCR